MCSSDLGLGSAVFFAQEMVLKKIVVADHAALVIVFLYLIFGAVGMAPFIEWRVWSSLSGNDAIRLAVSGIAAAVIGNVLFMSGLQDIRTQQASVLSYIEPLAAIAWGMIWLHEVPGAMTIAGGLLILGASYIIVMEPAPMSARAFE